MRVIFMGSGALGLTALRSIADCGHRIVLVVTPEDGPRGSDGAPYPSVAQFADRRGLPVVRNDRHLDDTVRSGAPARPDIVVSANWRKLIGGPVLECARFGGVNVHRSLLPAYGGLDPIIWAVANGERESGVTIHLLDERLDLGDIILQRQFPIGASETGFDVHRKSLALVAEMLPEALRQIEQGSAVRTPQDPAALKLFPRRTEKDYRIDWRKSNVEVHDLIRAQADPFPNAYSSIAGKTLRIKRASLASIPADGRPGEIIRGTPEGVVVLCGDGLRSKRAGLAIHEVQEPAGPPMEACAYFAAKTTPFDEA